MKSGVTNRKQRFWALLLAVVMVVGLLPTAGVKAETIEIERNADLTGKIPVGKVLTAGDLLTGQYEIQADDEGSLYVHYFDADINDGEDVYSSGVKISKNDGQDDEWFRQIVYDNNETYPISTYVDIFDNANLDESHQSDKWIVISEEDAAVELEDGEYEDDQVIYLQALPKYNIFWEDLDGATIYKVNEVIDEDALPLEFIPEPNTKIDLSNYKCTKEGYVFDGWEYGKNVIIPGDDPEEQNAYRVEVDYTVVNSITNDNCDSLDYGRCYDDDGFGYLVKSFDIKLRAKWRSVYTLKFYAESDWGQDPLTDYSGTMLNQIIDEKVDIANATINPVGFSRIGYTFDSWSAYKTTANGGDKFNIGNVQDKSSINNLVELGNQYPGNVFELYAQWNEDLDSAYTIKFIPNYPEAEITSAPYPDVPDDITGVKFWGEFNPDNKKYEQAYYELPNDEDLRNEENDPTHYIFNGWRVANPKEGIEVDDLSHYIRVSLADLLKEGEVSDNNVIEMVADWESLDYQISFDATNQNGIEIPEGVPTRIPKPPVEDGDPWALTYHDSITTPDLSEFNANGYDFIGWVFNPEHASDPDPDELIEKNKEYLVSELLAMSDAAQKAAKIEGEPGWFVPGDALEYVLTGVWKQKYTITYNKNAEDATGTMNPQSFYEGETVVIADCGFTRDGYVFSHWATEGNAAAPEEYDPEDVFPGDNEQPKNLVLYAQWDKIHTVTFEYNEPDRKENKTIVTQGVADGKFADEPTPAPSANGYSFKGWIFEEKSIDLATFNINDDVTFSGSWEPNAEVTLNFDGNGGKGTIEPISGPEGSFIELPKADAYSWLGYHFIGWDEDETAAEPDYVPGERYALKDTTLYAIWRGNKYTINFVTDPSGLDGWDELDYDDLNPDPDSLEPVTVEYDDDDDGQPDLQLLTDKAGHFTFCGWSFDPEGETKIFGPDEDRSYQDVLHEALYNYPGLMVTAGNDGVSGQVTLYAVWTPKKYTLNYIVNPNDLDKIKPNIGDYQESGIYYEEVITDWADIDKGLKDELENYKFIGWAFTKDAEKPVIHVGDEDDDPWRFFDIIDYLYINELTQYIITPDPDEVGNDYINLYAVWEPIPYYDVLFDKRLDLDDIKVHSGHDTRWFEEAADYSAVLETLEDLNENYKFLGWALDKEATKADFAGGETISIQDIIDKLGGVEDNEETIHVYAVWEPIPWYDVYFHTRYDLEGIKPVALNTSAPDKWFEEKADYSNTLRVLVDENKKYMFVGWAVDKNATKPDFPGGIKISIQDILDKNCEAVYDNGVYNITVYAVWIPAHTVQWVDDNGEVLDEILVQDGVENPKEYNGQKQPKKSSEDGENYELAGWEIVPNEDQDDDSVVYKPIFVGKEFTITWLAEENGLPLGEDKVRYGELPEYSIAKYGKPEKQPGGFATYTFNNKWEPAIHAVTGDQEYVAQFDMNGPENGQEGQGGDNGQGNQGGNNNPPVVIPPAITYYTITWANYNGAGATTTTQVAAGDRPSYNGTPAKAADDENTYTFIGWTPNITVATGDATYTAQFTATKKENNTPTPKPTSGPTKSRDYKINYYEEQDDGTLVKLKKTLNPDTYTYGVGAEIKYGIDKEGYKFLGWYSQKTGKRVTRISKNSKGEKTLIAKFVPIDDGTGEGNGNGSGNPASEFGILFVRLVDYATNSMTLKWQPIEGVDGYDIFGSRCNSKDVIRPYEPIDSVGADVSEYEMKELLAKTYYKFYIRAYILVNNEKRYITTSINVHGVTLNDTYGVADEINIDKIVLKYINGKSKTKYDSAKAGKSEDVINITMKVGQSLVLVSSEKSNTGKEIRAHRAISFESSNTNVCKVGKKKNHKYGKEVTGMDNTYKSYAITAVAAGECDIHAFAQNGIYTTIHVTVIE